MVEQETGIKLEFGKRYRTRDGIYVTEPLTDANDGTNYRFESRINDYPGLKMSIRSWLQGGHYLTRDREHPMDLVEAYETDT